MKVLINCCYGGFGLSEVAIKRAKELGCKLSIDSTYTNEVRTNPQLIQAVEELGEKANGEFAELKVIEIPDDINWHVEEYDGREHIAEDHRTWW